MHFFAEYGLFLAQTITFVLAAIFLFASLLSLSTKNRSKERLKISILNQRWESMASDIATHSESKACQKQLKKQHKQNLKSRPLRARLFVLDFKGDIMASCVDSLREEINAIMQTAKAGDEVLLRLESPGGVVPGYGLGATQLQRLKNETIPLTVAVDKIAASGGYLMACVADHIIAAPFAIIGSIGVITQLPNLHRFLQKHDIDFEQLTAGDYKRTLTMFGEVDDKARAKAQADIEAIHQIFKDHILKFREQLNIDEVATGEFWLAHDALTRHLIDRLESSDDYLLQQAKTKQIVHLQYQRKKRFGKRMQQTVTDYLSRNKTSLPYAM